MPGSLALASVVPGTVFPQTLSLAYSESQSFPQLSNTYHDGTIQQSLIQDGVNLPRPIRVWKLTKRLTAAQIATLETFWQTSASGGLNPFYFYSPFDQTPGQPIGSNYDPTGSSTQGRVTVVFSSPAFSSTVLIGLGNIGELSLLEIV
jgi:hypothetical protein